jgi:hypothetical protein
MTQLHRGKRSLSVLEIKNCPRLSHFVSTSEQRIHARWPTIAPLSAGCFLIGWANSTSTTCPPTTKCEGPRFFDARPAGSGHPIQYRHRPKPLQPCCRSSLGVPKASSPPRSGPTTSRAGRHRRTSRVRASESNAGSTVLGICAARAANSRDGPGALRDEESGAASQHIGAVRIIAHTVSCSPTLCAASAAICVTRAARRAARHAAAASMITPIIAATLPATRARSRPTAPSSRANAKPSPMPRPCSSAVAATKPRP